MWLVPPVVVAATWPVARVDNLSGTPVQVQSHHAPVETEDGSGNRCLDFIRQPAGAAYTYALAAAAVPGQQVDPVAWYVEYPGQVTDQVIVGPSINRCCGDLDFKAFAVSACQRIP